MKLIQKTAIIFTLFAFFACSLAFAQEEKKQGVSEESLDALMKTPAKPKPKVEETDEAKPAKLPEKPEQKMNFPVDPRKIKVQLKMKSGKSYKGVVKHFLVSGKIIDHLVKPDFGMCDGPTVEYGTDEFTMSWDSIKKIEFNKRNKENGEISCVELSDLSPDRLECIMINEFSAYAKDRKKKGKHLIINKQMFRFVIDTGKKTISIDSHLGKVKITNERDEQRKTKELAKELKKTFADEILWMKFK